MEIHKIIFDYIILLFIIGIVLVTLISFVKSIINKKTTKIIVIMLVTLIIGIGTSYLGFKYIYSGHIRKPSNILQYLEIILMICLSLFSFKLVLKPYYEKKPWKNKIPFFVIGIITSIVWLLLRYQNLK